MESGPSQRRLAAILCADVAGYSRLMGEDEHATLEALTACRGVFYRFVEQFHGRIVNAPGDSILAEFGSVVDAVGASVEIQRELAERNAEQPGGRRMDFRIGVNLGDVLVKDGDLYGDGVNIAARIQALAEPGGTSVSDTVYNAVRGKLPLEFDFQGEQRVKNIANPVRTYRVLSKPGAAAHRVVKAKRAVMRHWRRAAVGAAAVIVIAGAGALAFRTWGPAPESAPSTGARLPTIAVLPFQNLSGDAEQDYFADGISEELITLLAQFRDLSVIARNTMFTYKGKAVDVREVGKEVGADFVLEGSVRRSADAIRITAQLLSASDGKHLWAETFDAEPSAKSLFEMQEQVSEKVITTLGGVYGIISESQWRDSARKPPAQFSSYECILRAYKFQSLVSAENHLVARECIERIVTEEPTYADAWTWLAFILFDEYTLHLNERPGAAERARLAIRTALSIAPTSSTAIAVDAWGMYLNKDPRFFDRAAEAIAANPRDVWVLVLVGFATHQAGRREEGRRVLSRAHALTKFVPNWFYAALSCGAFLEGEYAKGIEHGLNYNLPGYYWYHVFLAINYAGLGDVDAAREQIRLTEQAYPDFASAAYNEFRIWIWDEGEVETFVQGLRDAGMNIPPESKTN